MEQVIEDTKQEARIEVRCSPADKGLMEEAASLLGINLSSFVKAHLLKVAREIVRLSQITPLSERDGKLFYELIEADEAPSLALQSAAEKFKEYSSRAR
jgi:uncharacterized protein (DUF1778 family)